jgi:hypothetical protein
MSEFTTLADITRASVKTYHSIPAANTDYDSLIDAHLLGARSFVQEYCRHDFQSAVRTSEKPYIDKRTSAFYLKYFPIASMTSLTEGGLALVEDTNYSVDKDTGMVEKICSSDITNPDRDVAFWSTVRNAVIVTYTGGEALTDEVIMAVKEIAGIRAGIKKRTYTDNEGIERVATLNSIPKDILSVLDRHKHRARIL